MRPPPSLCVSAREYRRAQTTKVNTECSGGKARDRERKREREKERESWRKISNCRDFLKEQQPATTRESNSDENGQRRRAQKIAQVSV